MSINVTVKGNPISIKRGKMVTGDPYQCKSEFEKRRLMRLEQVRQQSKDIAEDVRNRVRKEKNKQISAIERDGEEKLKNWKNRKLLEIQNQYEEALSEFGSGHKQAEQLADESETAETTKRDNAYKAKVRGDKAAAQLQVEKNVKHYEEAKPLQHKKLARDVENSRAASLTRPKKPHTPTKRKRHRAKASADINITIPVTEESETEPPTPNVNRERSLGQVREEDRSDSTPSNTEESDESIDLTRGAVKKTKTIPPRIVPDTRISDRIKRREVLASQSEYQDTIAEVDPVELAVKSTRVRDHIYSRPPLPTYEFDQFSEESVCNCQCICNCGRYVEKTEKTDIPERPPVKLKDTSRKSHISTVRTGHSDSQKVQYFDHSNKFVHKKTYPSSTFVEKVAAESLEVIPDVLTETDIQEKMKLRDREAEQRGRRALEKQKIQRDYRELMEKLPLLQKQERISEINTDKPEYHMSEERLKEMHRLKQNKLENAYSKLRVREPAIVTLPKRTLTPQESGKRPEMQNVGEWDVDYDPNKMFTADEVRQIIDSFTSKNGKDRREKLKDLLKNLKHQKEQLLSELKSLPRDDSISELINGLTKLDSLNELKKEHLKRKRTESVSSSDNTTDAKPSTAESQKDRHQHVRRRYAVEVVSPRKKCTRRNVLVLQNMSTQTTPRTSDNDGKRIVCSDKTVQTSVREQICEKLHVPCDCHKLTEQTSEELCKIVIKINDEESPQVIIKDKENVPVKSPVKEESTKTRVKTKDTGSVSKREEKARIEENVKRTTKIVTDRKKWRDELSKNSVSTSSTSYLSPPEFSNVSGSTKKSFVMSKSVASGTNLSLLGDSRSMDPKLLKYIKKLLSMTKESVDKLSVSSSDVPTPSQSVINLETNNPMAQLHRIIKHFNLKIEDFANEDSSSESVSKLETPESTLKSKSTPCDCRLTEKPSEVASQYSDVAENCSKRIAHLASMIQKLREDKENLIHSSKSSSSSISENDHLEGNQSSTRYLDVPDYSKKKSLSSNSSSTDEEEQIRKILEVDLELAEKLKNYPSKENVALDEKTSKVTVTEPINSDQDLLFRLRRLMNKISTETEPKQPPEEEEFVPLLIDIPKLPKLEMPAKTLTFTNNQKKPPPSKGLSIAKRMNGNISSVPHELSTIVEADSQVSTKVDLTSPIASKHDLNKENKESPPSSGHSLPDIVTEIQEGATEARKGKAPTSKKDGKSPTKSGTAKSQLTSSSSNDEPETIEAMLRSIGMSWAIPTLQKTREALALTSSSSSLDFSGKSKVQTTGDSSGSDLNLSEFLKKQILRKISSSTLKSDTSPISLLEVSEISSIHGSISVENPKQRTSTPIISSKSTNISKVVTFSDESELSSVKGNISKEEKHSFNTVSGDSQSKLE